MAKNTNGPGNPIDWLEHWPSVPNFRDESAKEVYKDLVRIYLNTWLAMFNSHPGTTEKYQLKNFGEKETGPTVFRPFATLSPDIQVRIDTDASGNPRTHLIPPEPPPPPDEEI